ncbi:hypothetical protein GDO86_018371 [Hymenochirus boettgeri]|uniref:Uncharacterized protein n=1 Tax=Hymenochirus boettgeri TaxID=247094 RepID=A0A8T2II79_9PIPI|nr:hypothetical protein GDO86_018371 [Hymenochirus boettgeri]
MEHGCVQMGLVYMMKTGLKIIQTWTVEFLIRRKFPHKTVIRIKSVSVLRIHHGSTHSSEPVRFYSASLKRYSINPINSGHFCGIQPALFVDTYIWPCVCFYACIVNL